MMFLSYLLSFAAPGLKEMLLIVETGELWRLYLIFLSELSSVDQTMIFFSIIFSCILIAVSGILEEKHIIFDDPVHGPHDGLSSVNQISAS